MKTIVIEKLTLDHVLLKHMGLTDDNQRQLLHDIALRLKGHHASGIANHEGSIRYYAAVLSESRLWHLTLDINAEGRGVILNIS